ncbi:MAG TPA: LPS assembly protein LptD [Alphaproteobacteria bacterium]|nr:LPS assembly protein LptD [Alphaproteobacteria bacterium]
MLQTAHRSSRLAYFGVTTAVALLMSTTALGQNRTPFTNTTVKPTDVVEDKGDQNVVLTADSVTKDDINNTVSAKGHVEFVRGASMLLAEHVTWNENTDIVVATGDVKLVDDQGNIMFGDYLEITDDMRQAFIQNVSALLADNSRLVGKQANKDANITTIDRGVYSPCELCKEDPTKPPTWQIKAVKIIHDKDEKRIYYHDATFEVDGIPVAWTPYYSTYDPTVKRASGFLETLPGYRSQLGGFIRTSYYWDIAPDIDAVLEGGYFTHQGPLIGGEYRERFAAGQIQLSGSITESDIRQNPTPLNQDEKTVRGHIFGSGDFDLDDHWRAGFEFARSLDDLYVLKYQYSSLQILPTHFYAEGFYDRDYINLSAYSYQDLRAGITEKQPYVLPDLTYSFFGDPGEFLGGRWADSGGVLAIQRYPGESVQRLANNFSWQRKLMSDLGIVTVLNASVETDYYWTQNAAPDPVTQQITAKSSVGRFFPQAYAVVSYPFVRPMSYADLVIEPIVSAVVAPHTSNQSIPNEDSQDVQLDWSNLFAANRYPGIDRIDDGSRVTYGVKTSLNNIGIGSTSLFLGESYRISGSSIFPPNSGLQTRFSDYVGEFEVNPGRYVDIDYRFEWSNDLNHNRLQEVNFRVGPDDYGIFGTYIFANEVDLPNFAAPERNELSLAAYVKFADHWQVAAAATQELTQPRQLLRYSLSAGYTDDCASFTVNLYHDATLLIGGTSGTAISFQFSLKNLGIFTGPSIH